MAFLFNNILQVPERALLNKKITKAFFLKNFELTTSEKKLLNEIESIDWMASIKHSSINILPVKTDSYTFEELQVIICTLPDNSLENTGNKCAQLIQKYIPYHSVVIVQDNNHFLFNVSEKRINLADTNKRIIETDLTTPILSKLYKNEITNAFFEAIDFNSLDKNNLESLYKSYIVAIVQFKASSITGNFNLRGVNRSSEDLLNIERIEKLEKEIITLSNQIKKETQQNQRVSLNIEIQNRRQEITAIKELL